MANIDPALADVLRKDLPAAEAYNRNVRNGENDPIVCGGCFGAGSGGRCCICGGLR